MHAVPSECSSITDILAMIRDFLYFRNPYDVDRYKSYFLYQSRFESVSKMFVAFEHYKTIDGTPILKIRNNHL